MVCAHLHADPPAILNHRINLIVRALLILRACVPRMTYCAPHISWMRGSARTNTRSCELSLFCAWSTAPIATTCEIIPRCMPIYAPNRGTRSEIAEIVG